MTLLNKMSFNTGINRQVMNALQNDVLKMNPLDRYCCVAFDEMSLEPGLTYDNKTDSIEGFENCGEGSTSKFADHAMVFMV